MFVINSRNKNIINKFLKLTLTAFSTVRLIPEAYLEPRRTSTINLFFVIFTVDVRLCAKYALAYIYTQVSPIETIYILYIFAVKYLFSYKRRMK